MEEPENDFENEFAPSGEMFVEIPENLIFFSNTFGF